MEFRVKYIYEITNNLVLHQRSSPLRWTWCTWIWCHGFHDGFGDVWCSLFLKNYVPWKNYVIVSVRIMWRRFCRVFSGSWATTCKSHFPFGKELLAIGQDYKVMCLLNSSWMEYSNSLQLHAKPYVLLLGCELYSSYWMQLSKYIIIRRQRIANPK